MTGEPYKAPTLEPIDRGPHNSVVLSKTKWRTVSVEAVQPRRRDVWKIMRGTYRPQVRRTSSLSMAYKGAVVREIWNGPCLREAMYASNPLMDMLRKGSA